MALWFVVKNTNLLLLLCVIDAGLLEDMNLCSAQVWPIHTRTLSQVTMWLSLFTQDPVLYL